MAQDKNMLGDFLGAIIAFAWKMIRWAAWAAFRLIELAAGGIATYLKNSLNNT